ncbi:MAG TPA: mycofactocin-coupled SDR family oxidoreductase, partial [Acidimicrobiales bacterium]|nr:mycofactocin-coupled SDR family oxidoreductase [Acidimicrobiales bacterium]
MGRLDGKVAFVTGAARGQGRAHSVRLASEGADIIAVDICGGFESVRLNPATPADLEETARLVEKEGRRIVARRADVRDLDGLQAAFDEGVRELGGVDVVVANAGVITCAWSWEMTPAQWQEVIDVNLTGVFHTAKVAIPTLIRQGRGGSIVMTSSTAGLYGQPFTISYTAAKHGVVGLVRAMALELAEHNIRVNSIHPTGVRTEMYTNMGDLMQLINSRAATLGPVFMNSLPVEVMEPEDIAAVVAFLASDESKYITGAQVPVDAGKL